MIIEWFDSTGHVGWLNIKEAEKRGLAFITEVGFIVSSDADKIVLCSAFSDFVDDGEMVDGVRVIQRATIKKIIPLRRYNGN